jgi:hypothetical protein
MKQFLAAFICLIVFNINSKSQDEQKTHAFFMIGNYANSRWEKLVFDLTNNGKEITYSFLKKADGLRLQVLGTKYIGAAKVLMTRIPGYPKLFYIIRDRKGKRIIMKSSDGKFNKAFPLGYEGPVNGRGTYCGSCANEPDEAFAIVNLFF